MSVEKHFLIDHIRRLYFVERTEVAPMPELPNRDRVRFKEAMYPLMEPFDLKGVGFTMNRYLDHTRQDDTWLYVPQLRRVRRLSSAQRSDALFGQDTDQDSYEGYQGNIAWMDWTFLGEKTILATMHAKHLPVKCALPRPGDFMHDDVWEPRNVWIVAGTTEASAVRVLATRDLPRQGDLPYSVHRALRSRRRALEGVGQQLPLRTNLRARVRRTHSTGMSPIVPRSR